MDTSSWRGKRLATWFAPFEGVVESSLLVGDCPSNEFWGVPWGVRVAVDERAAFTGIEGVCEDCKVELRGSVVCEVIVVGTLGVTSAGFGFARLRGPILLSRYLMMGIVEVGVGCCCCRPFLCRPKSVVAYPARAVCLPPPLAVGRPVVLQRVVGGDCDWRVQLHELLNCWGAAVRHSLGVSRYRSTSSGWLLRTENPGCTTKTRRLISDLLP